MSVQRYSRLEMQAIIQNILNKPVTILPIGNHELRRHLVYKVKTEDGDFVFKYYYQNGYGGREISTLKLLENSSVKHAKLIDYGTFGQDREWLMMTLLDGMPFDKIKSHLTEDNLIRLYETMGEELGKIHELKVFDHFGSLKENGDFVKAYDNLSNAFMANNAYAFKKIYEDKCSAKDILIMAIKKIEQNADTLDEVKEPRLTHFDYSPRNIFVHKENDQRTLGAVLDFELARPWDKNADFCHLILRDFPENPSFETAFFKGYKKYSSLDHNFHRHLDLHMLNLCVGVCSWAEHLAPNYYEIALNKIIQILNSSKNLK
ncbi:MAG: aminoglycoside phosphotransferase family protein [Clostridia bacterium]|nr:aminoglycoside phosphotransferase family protein [Clostridia bacterium]